MDFDPTLLRAFAAVVEAGGFTRAAQRLHLTQSAVSHQIRRLEEQVGRPLLHRTTRRLTLTEDGEDFLRGAEPILRLHDALNRRFQPSPVAGTVRFGAPENFLGDRLPHLLRQFARAFPAVRLDVHIGPYSDLRTMVDADDLDLAVVLAVSGDAPGGDVLRRTRFVWVAAETFDVPSGSLPFAFSPPPCVHRRVGVAALDGAPLDWHIVFTSPSQEGLHAAVLAGLAVTALPRSDVRSGMKIVDGRYGLPPMPDVDFRLIWRGGERRPAACEFGRMVIDLSESPSRAAA